jgi:uncharacterized protein YxjI
MAIETIELEGDFVIKNSAGKAAFRFHANEDAFTIYALQDRITITDTEAQELIGWLQRRFEEPLPRPDPGEDLYQAERAFIESLKP